MNERISELEDQALEHPDLYSYDKERFLEIFAELIEKETMQVVANNLPQNTYIDVADAVIEHFGV